MWSAQAVRDSKIDHFNAIYPPCLQPQPRNSAVGWHWNTHISVQGLMVGARGTIPKHIVHLWDALKLNGKRLHYFAIVAIRGSIVILRNHILSFHMFLFYEYFLNSLSRSI